MDILETLIADREALVAKIHCLQTDSERIPDHSVEHESLTSSIASLQLQLANIQSEIADLIVSIVAAEK